MSRRLISLWLLLLAGFGLAADTAADRLVAAAEAGDLESVRQLLDEGTDVDATTASGITALMMAAHGGHLSLVRYLLARRADLNAQTKNGVTPLIAAAKEGHLDIVNLLLERGARTDLTLANGQNARDIALDEGHRDVADAVEEAARNRPDEQAALPSLPAKEDQPFTISDVEFERVRRGEPHWTFTCRFRVRNLTDRPLGLRVTFLCIDPTGHTIDNNNKRDVFLGPDSSKTVNETISVNAMVASRVVEIRPEAKEK
jgi:hypothetical protein